MQIKKVKSSTKFYAIMVSNQNCCKILKSPNSKYVAEGQYFTQQGESVRLKLV